MKSIILCAGYGTRLYPLTKNKPKALLDIARKPLLEHIIEKIDKIQDVDEIFIVSNNRFYQNFLDWSSSQNFKKKVKVLNDGTIDNETRLGGIGDLWFAVEKEKINNDILVILGDNLFDCELNEIVGLFNATNIDVVGLYDIKDLEAAKRFGVLTIKDNKITSFEEKPENPKSTLISTGIYIYSKNTLKKIENYMKTGNNKDGPGYLVPYLLNFQDINGFVVDGNWYDIGSKEIYDEVNKIYEAP